MIKKYNASTSNEYKKIVQWRTAVILKEAIALT